MNEPVFHGKYPARFFLILWLQIFAWATLEANDSHLTDIYFQIEVEMTWEPATIIKK